MTVVKRGYIVGTKERRKREKESLRQEILDAARQLFLKNGFENVSMRQIAEKIEYSPTTIYLYFRDKAELFQSICEETFARLEGELAAIVKGDSDPVACLRKGAQAYIRFGLKYPHHYQLVFLTSHPQKGDTGFPYTGRAGDRAFRYLLEVISQGIEKGKFRKSDPMVLSQTAWTALHGVTSLLITMTEFPWVDRDVLVESAVDTLTQGLKA
jgi:AcrR family transcriptional regulator